MNDRVAVIGAGWAGMAAAAELAAAGRRVDVFEASRSLGGRARATHIDGLTVDNGQHILVGAYTETLRLMRMVGADPQRLLQRIPLRFEFPGEFLMQAPRLPAPLHIAFALLLARGLDWNEKRAAIRLMRRLRAHGYRVAPDCSVTRTGPDSSTAVASSDMNSAPTRSACARMFAMRSGPRMGSANPG